VRDFPIYRNTCCDMKMYIHAPSLASNQHFPSDDLGRVVASKGSLVFSYVPCTFKLMIVPVLRFQVCPTLVTRISVRDHAQYKYPRSRRSVRSPQPRIRYGVMAMSSTMTAKHRNTAIGPSNFDRNGVHQGR